MNIGVLDYGAGNLKNVCRAIEHLGFKYSLVSSEEDVLSIDKLVIPGVGAFKVAMEQLASLELIEPIKLLAERNVPIMGICLGMQLLFESSTEFGESEGLGLIKGSINSIPSTGLSGNVVKVPHIGWNELIIDNKKCKIVKGVGFDDAVYFVHSFIAKCTDSDDLKAHCINDGLILPAIVQRGNVFGCQFHPEKSGEVGLNIFKNFLMLVK